MTKRKLFTIALLALGLFMPSEADAGPLRRLFGRCGFACGTQRAPVRRVIFRRAPVRRYYYVPAAPTAAPVCAPCQGGYCPVPQAAAPAPVGPPPDGLSSGHATSDNAAPRDSAIPKRPRPAWLPKPPRSV